MQNILKGKAWNAATALIFMENADTRQPALARVGVGEVPGAVVRSVSGPRPADPVRLGRSPSGRSLPDPSSTKLSP
ncbi:MAG: hypothetical protein ACRYGL_09060 [Janthinobacterium lividum]